MTDDIRENDDLEFFPEPGVLWTRPYVTKVEIASRVPGGATIRVTGGGHARCYVRLLDAHTRRYLSETSQMGDYGEFVLNSSVLNDGEYCVFVWLWNGKDDWWMASNIHHVWINGLKNEVDLVNEDSEAHDNDELNFSSSTAINQEIKDGEIKGSIVPSFWDLNQGARINGLASFNVTANANWNINIYNAYDAGDWLCSLGKTNNNGHATLTLLKPLPLGINEIAIMSWVKGDWGISSDVHRVVVLPQPEMFTSTLPELPETLRGGNGVGGAHMEVWEAHGALLHGGGITSHSWQVYIPSLPKNPIDLVCRQVIKGRKYVSGTYSEYSPIRTVSVQTLNAPSIAYPTPNQSLPNTDVYIAGVNAAPGEMVVIKNESETVEYGVSKPANSDGFWSVTISFAGHLGSITIKARHLSYPNANWSELRTFRLPLTPATPEITDPAPSSLQNAEFTLTGNEGVAGATLRVFVSQTDTKVGEVGPLSGSNWSCPVDKVPPGATSLVAIQTISGVDSARSVARTFKVRPPMLGNITPTFTTENEVNFAGTGVEGATIVFTSVSGGVTAPDSVVVKDDKTWDTTATNWPFGKYSAVVIQKVGDAASGWVESRPHSFDVQVPLPVPSDVTYTKVYRPTISGKGKNGATVLLRNSGGSLAAPDVLVSDGKWSGQVIEGWWGGGPMYQKEIHIQQTMEGHNPSGWFVLKVTIPPLAPVIEKIEEGVLSPTFTGTCWSQDATVVLTFSDSGATQYPATVIGSNWSFQRETLFAEDVPLSVTVTQNVAQQNSLPASQNFIVSLPIPQPEITDPQSGSQVGRDLTVHGKNGMTGFTMQLRDAQSGADLGIPKTLTSDGVWFIELLKLEFRPYNIVAVQKRNQRESVPSERIDVTVVLLPPVITVPSQNGQLPRTAMLEGKGMPGGDVTIWLEGAAEPLVSKVPVDNDSNWQVEVTLPVGFKNIQAGQIFEDQTSLKSEMFSFSVVPAAPIIESPVMGAHIGRRTVVSGFGVSGDTVTVALTQPTRTVLGSSVVLEDRTWSMTLEFALPGGDYALVAVASYDGFDSADSPERPVVLGTYLPAFESPAAGQWTSDPVGFNGQGRAGVGEVQSWFSSERIWAPDLPVTTAWQGRATQPLPHGGNWCRFKQTITDDADGATVSDYVESKRFEVLPPPTKS